MRVITGSARGRKLCTPAGSAVRPTAAMVKEAVFSVIQFEVEGARVLDLFAGSGQMGIEALSRGARSCVMVDNNKESLTAIKQNLTSTGLSGNATVSASDAGDYLRGYRGEPFDIAFLDPPYDKGLLEPVLKLLSGSMSDSGIILCELPAGAEPPPPPEGFILKKAYKYGKTCVLKYLRPEPEE